jgi:hypothetical protein
LTQTYASRNEAKRSSSFESHRGSSLQTAF